MKSKQEERERERDKLMMHFFFLKDHHGKFQAPRAIREIKKFAQKEMKTTVVQIKPNLNTRLWEKGVRNVPNRIRVKISREPKKVGREKKKKKKESRC